MKHPDQHQPATHPDPYRLATHPDPYRLATHPEQHPPTLVPASDRNGGPIQDRRLLVP